MKDRKRAPQRETKMGLAWYRPEEWSKLLEASVDRDRLEDTHAEWLRGAESTFQRLIADGLAVEKIEVRVDKLIAWCRKEGRPVDADARAAYVSFILWRTAQLRG